MERVTSLQDKFLTAVDISGKNGHYKTSGEIRAVLTEFPELGREVTITELSEQARQLIQAPDATHVVAFENREASEKFHRHLMNRFIDRKMDGPNMPRTYSYPN